MMPPNSEMYGSRRMNLLEFLLRVSTGTKCIIEPNIKGKAPMVKTMW